MNIIKQKQSGFAVLGIISLVIVILAVSGAAYFVVNKQKNDSSQSNTATSTPIDTKKTATKIKHLGVDLDYYDTKTNKAGDFVFTKDKLEFNRLFFDYGFVVPANSAGPEKKNPQPTFIVPLGTKVHALIDGEVHDVPKLYSNDYSVMLKGKDGDLIFETEHVINVTVKKGDKVKAGDIIAEVSDYDAKNYAGYGLVEIGILKGGNPPSHICPFDYLDESIKDDTLKKVTALQKAWEEYRGDNTIYDEANVAIPGCVTSDPIEG